MAAELLASLKVVKKNERVHVLQKLSEYRPPATDAAFIRALHDNKLFIILSKVLDANFPAWSKDFPKWVKEICYSMFIFRDEPNHFPQDHMKMVIESLRKYIKVGSVAAIDALATLSAYATTKQLLLQDQELYNLYKGYIGKRNMGLEFFLNCASSMCAPWKMRLMEDKQLISTLLTLANELVWDLFTSLSFHSDAKTLLPTKLILRKASDWSDRENTADVFALLCSDDDLKTIKLDESYIEQRTTVLASLLATGESLWNRKSFNLLSLVMPLSNLAAADVFKDEIGRKAATLLLKVVTEQLLDIALIQMTLERSKLEAARALWNLAYLESNRALILKANGVEKLTSALAQAHDPLLKRNIEGILYMIAPSHTAAPPATEKTAAHQGHVMLSYNWGNQPIVKRIALSLKQRGYRVWLDVEQMQGSTLEAMALAVEHSELILVCMSQKYKDSPNCRLEGEYCINRKVKFLPLMMQQGYRPDGWLGIVLGAKLYYDFTDENNWEAKMDELAKAIQQSSKAAIQAQSPPASPLVTSKPVSDWSFDDIRKWMNKEGLDHLVKTFDKHKMDGRALLELKTLHNLQKPHFFLVICNNLGIADVGEVLRLSAAIRKL